MSTSKSTELSTLVRQRGNIRGRLTTQTQYINTLKLVDFSSLSNAQVIEIKLHLKKCETLYKDFETFQDKIELLCDESEIQEQINTRSTIENQFITAISTLQDILEKLNPVNVKSQLPSQSNESSVKLPTIKLPVFDGSYLKWLEFRDTYLSLIHENASIQDINKFHYLRASLEGSASEVIKSLEFTSINYKIAWDLLCARYDNKRVLINSHLKSLHLINPITTESHKALRNLLDHVNKNMRALKALGIPTEYWDVHIIFIITMKLDATTNMKWEEYLSNCSDNPTLDQFYTFIRNRADVLENAVSRTTNHSESSSNSNSNNHNKKFWNNNNSVSKNNKSFDNLKISSPVASGETVCDFVCLCCNKQGHRIYDCPKFKDMDVPHRVTEVKRLKVCHNCLREGHNFQNCRLKSMCRHCKYSHNTLLHLNKNDKHLENINSTVASQSQTLPPVTLSGISNSSQVLLCTAVVSVKNMINNETYPVRALLDSGSQSSFVTDNLKRKLNLPVHNIEPLRVSGINNVAFSISERVTLGIESRNKNFSTMITCLVVPKVTGTLPNSPVNILELDLPPNIELADPYFYCPAEVDLLLGADIFWDLVGFKRITLGVGRPVLQESQLGWLVSGPVGIYKPGHVICNYTHNINDNLQKFWEIEELNLKINIGTPEERLCESHFQENVKRLSNGRFSVKMPLKEIPEEALGDSFI
ncbi:hypothetical protein HF086_016829 [Spodoptera exigua]|uniref:CCHC-type domain-containing protein n=1 Tax=Spodoptera exigua TaxID=7107 RepID=A0A922M0N4_SPOEX|nr:hypothetical protein HF086_016829 [Spodoptera exigua]